MLPANCRQAARAPQRGSRALPGVLCLRRLPLDYRETMRSKAIPRSTIWLNRFAWFTAVATLLLICSGGMVTSKGVGLAVPDWPTTFGYNMFLFPISKWVGGVLFEHTHRLIASTVGFLTIILAVWLWRSAETATVKTLGLLALAAVIL